MVNILSPVITHSQGSARVL